MKFIVPFLQLLLKSHLVGLYLEIILLQNLKIIFMTIK